MIYGKRSKFKKSAFKGCLRIACKRFLIRPANDACQVCGYNKYIGNLSFHHKNPVQKQFNISAMMLTCTLKQLVEEASKCILVCHNCHGEIHSGLISQQIISKIPVLNFTPYKLPVNVIKWYKRSKGK